MATKGPVPTKEIKAYVYIDNSNIWIEGQRVYAQKERYKRSRHGDVTIYDIEMDPRWRVQIGRFRELIERTTVKWHKYGYGPSVEVEHEFYLYGSEPPPVDSIWRAIEERKIRVHTLKRSTYTGKEKGVDHLLSCDISMKAAQDKARGLDSNLYILASGDGDLAHVMKRIVELGFSKDQLHVWSWRDSISKMYEKDETLKANVTIHYLDEHIDNIGFCEKEYDIKHARVKADSLVILYPLRQSNAVMNFHQKLTIPYWTHEHLPKRPEAESADIVTIPAVDLTHDQFVELFEQAKKDLRPYELEVLTWLEYSQRYRTNRKVKLTASTRYDLLPRDYSGPEEDSPSGRSGNDKDDRESNEGDFTKVTSEQDAYKKWAAKKEQKSNIACFFGYYCREMLKCSYGHTQAERQYFEVHSAPKKPIKTKLCSKGSMCLLDPKKCPYAHGEDDLRCTKCDGKGHDWKKCPPNARQ
ncbi:hypothetical protein VTJ83DRAFT_2871 [Remersonia thermophila]|uniref:NYN domain-containing protein n=1 Tax=Remersonia thermophila TaxID=72144 RepID=A0ABR4DCF0_9PEZI